MLRELAMKFERRAARYYNSKPFHMLNSAPIVTFTFDDVPDTAYINGATILENHGIRGTFYISVGKCDTRDSLWHWISAEQVRDLHHRGHEIGCHTFSHANVETLNKSTTDEECQKNHDALRRLCGDIQLTNFAYPYGRVNIFRKLQLEKRFDTCRGIFDGVNFGRIDLGLLKIIELHDQRLSPEKLQRVLRETCDHNGWLIFYTHDITNPPSRFGCSPDLLHSTIESVQTMGLTCATVRDALHQIGYFRH